MADRAPTVVILAGPNRAGKTTSARTLLAETLRLMTFVNADLIAQGLAGFDPEGSAIEAGRIMLRRLRDPARQRADFAFETTLAGRSHARFLQSLRDSGYRLHLVYFRLASEDLAVARVAERVRVGGHGVPEATIRRRYRRSLDNFRRVYRPLVNSWEVYDNSHWGAPRLAARGDDTGEEAILDRAVWDCMQKGCTNA
jgi:predicted ABC-type ATPase